METANLIIHATDSSFDAEVLKSDKPSLVDFWAPWCGPCRMMGPVFEELSEDFKGKLAFAKLNVDEENDLAGQFTVQGIPCLILTKKGKEVDRIVGFMPKEALRDKIKSILK
jgi:thioredoxin 1